MNKGINYDVKSLINFITLSNPHKDVTRNQEMGITQTKYLQNWLQSSVGFLVYPVKYSRQEVSNEVHEMSKFMDKENTKH